MTDGRSDSDVKDHGRESATPCGDAEPAFVKNASFCGKTALFVFNEIAGFVWKYATIPLPFSR